MVGFIYPPGIETGPFCWYSESTVEAKLNASVVFYGNRDRGGRICCSAFTAMLGMS